ncbi:MAG: hypothetical protein LQ346_003681 [Caloplaca aetnensis]|nr:MAG: hypothetical protein LQ346_003681 [Caloplaca aetnensis]
MAQSIIESLKYATTGDLPPNSKNGAFIHDPKMCGEKEVLAQVKLQFKDPSGAKLVATRSVSLTVQRTGKYQQKTLESSLLRTANGERVVISSRNAEIDKFVPQYLGVSKAVLDNVIFCHQDESLWPMSDSSTLKKKFDEIFEALKYTKAIQNIKDVRKHYMDELKQLQIREQNSKVMKDRADKRLRKEVETLDKLTKEANKKWQDSAHQSANFYTIVQDLKTKQKEAKLLRDHTDKLAHDLTIRPESDDWLQNELDQYDQRTKVHEDQKQQQTNNYNQLSRAMENTRDRLQRKHGEAGRYEQQQASHEREIEARKDLVRRTARSHNIRGYETDLGDIQISEFRDRIFKLHKEQTANAERVRADTEGELRQMRGTLSRLGERKSGYEEGKTSAKQQTLANDQKIASFQLDLDAIEVDEGAEAVLDSNVEEINESLKQAKEQYRTSSWDAKLNEAKMQQRRIKEELEQANQEVVQASKISKDLAQLDYLRKELSDRQRGLETLKSVHNERLQIVIGKQWNAVGLDREFQSVIEQRSKRLRECENRRDNSTNDLKQTELRLSSCREDLRKAEEGLEKCAKSITSATNEDKPDTYPTDLAGIEHDRDVLKADVDDYGIVNKLYKKSIKTAQRKGICELCERNFQGQSEISQFMRKMEEKIQQDTLKESQKQLEGLEVDLQKVRSVGPIYSNWLQLSNTEVPRLRSEIQELEQSKATLVRQTEHYDKEVADQVDSKNEAESLSKPIATIVRFQTDISNFTELVKKHSGLHEAAGVSRSMDELQEQLASLNAQVEAKQILIDKLAGEKQHARDSINAKEINLRDAQKELSTATHQLEKKSGLVKRIEEFRISNREHRDKIKRLEEEIQALRPQMIEMEDKLKDVKQRGDKKDRELQQGLSKLSESLFHLKAADTQIQDYLDNGGLSRLDKCCEEIQDLQQDIEKTDAEQKQIATRINKAIEELSNHANIRRTIKENLDFRKSKRELEEVVREIGRLSEQNAEADLERLEQQAKSWENQYHKHTTEKSSRLATMKAKDDQLEELLRDWKTDYQNAAHEYKEAHIKVEASIA